MDYRQAIAGMSAEVYEGLKRAVELGKWPDGRALTRTQRENALQAVIAWGEAHLARSERVGCIDAGAKAGASCEDAGPAPLRWRD